MPAATASCIVPLHVPGAWEFVRDYANWASLFPGYQGHTAVGAGVSRWTVRGDVGMFSRVVELEVRIAEETAQHHIRFTVQGMTENLAGHGLFELTAVDAQRSRLALTFEITAGGPLGPVVNALLGPRLRTLLETFAAALSRRLASSVAP